MSEKCTVTVYKSTGEKLCGPDRYLLDRPEHKKKILKVLAACMDKGHKFILNEGTH